ncbi:MAG: hypothetical protein M3Q30_07960 [Actinomycetota bacterium]|nr:hypothetical protein [Actinomycetota bacterium]
MIGWGSILYGAALSAAVAGAVVAIVLRERRPLVLAAVGASAFAAPIAWNSILRATHAAKFFTDLPIAIFPASWQDTGSGAFTLAAASAVLGALMRREPAGRVLMLAALAAVAALLVDIYLY